MRFLYLSLAAMALVCCSNGDSLPLDPGPDFGEPRKNQKLFTSWDQVSFYADPNHFFGDTTFSEWPDNTLEIGEPDKDTLLLATPVTIPLMDRVIDSWHRNYLGKSNYARSFRLVVADNETTDVDSVILEVRTKNQDGILYGDIPPVLMTFYKAAKNNGKIYFQNQISKDTTLGLPVLFSQAPGDAGAFDEAYVLVLKEKTDLWHFEYAKMPEPIKPCAKEWVCRETMVSFSDYRCPESSSSADTTLQSSSSKALDTLTILEPIFDVSAACYTVTGWRNVTECDSVCID